MPWKFVVMLIGSILVGQLLNHLNKRCPVWHRLSKMLMILCAAAFAAPRPTSSWSGSMRWRFLAARVWATDTDSTKPMIEISAAGSRSSSSQGPCSCHCSDSASVSCPSAPNAAPRSDGSRASMSRLPEPIRKRVEVRN